MKWNAAVPYHLCVIGINWEYIERKIIENERYFKLGIFFVTNHSRFESSQVSTLACEAQSTAESYCIHCIFTARDASG